METFTASFTIFANFPVFKSLPLTGMETPKASGQRNALLHFEDRIAPQGDGNLSTAVCTSVGTVPTFG